MKKILSMILVLLLVCGTVGAVSASAAAMEKGKNVYVSENGGSLKVRAGEGTNYGVNGYVSHGDAITLLGIGDTWAHIRVNKTGVTGYIKNIYLYGYATAGWGATVEELLNGGSGSGSSAAMERGKNVYVSEKGGTLKVRAGEGTNYGVNGYVSHGDAITLLGIGDTWAHIRVNKTGVTGYIKNIYLYGYATAGWGITVDELLNGGNGTGGEIPMERGKNVYVSENGGTLKVRAGEGTNYGVNGYVYHGDAITLLGIGDTWAHIRVNKTGVTGYIKNEYLYGYATAGWGMTVEELLGGGSGSSDGFDGAAYDVGIVATKFNASTVNVRAGAGSGYEKVGTVKSGTFLKIYGSEGNWYKVNAGSGLNGYISKTYISTGVPAVTTANLNVRAGEGSSTQLITMLNKGTNVTLLSVNGNWGKILYGKSAMGYVSVRYLKY